MRTKPNGAMRKERFPVNTMKPIKVKKGRAKRPLIRSASGFGSGCKRSSMGVAEGCSVVVIPSWAKSVSRDSCSKGGIKLPHSKLLAGEALEVGHLRGHFLAGGVGGGANALDAQLEFVGVGGARESFVERNELFRVEIEERLVERLHAVLAGAGGDGVMNQARLVRVDNAIANVSGGDHHFDGRHAALVIGAAHQALRYDRFQRGGQLQTDLLLLRRRKDGDDALNRFGGVEGVQGGKHEVAGFGGEQRGGNRFEVAHFADQNHVRVLTKSG